MHAGLSLYLPLRRSFSPALFPLFGTPVFLSIFLLRRSFFPSLVPCSRLVSSLLHAALSLYLPPPAFIFPSLVPCSRLFPLFGTPVFPSIFLLRRSFFPALFPVHSSFPLFCTPACLSISSSGVHFSPPCPLLPSRFLFFARRSFSLSPTPAFIFPSLVSSSRLFSSFLHAGLSLCLHLRRSFFPALFPVHSSFPLFCTPVFFSISISGVHFSPPCFLFTPRFLFFARRSFSLSPSPAFIFPRLVSCSLLVSSFLHAGLFLYLHLRRSFFPALFPVHSSFPLFCTPVFPSIFLLRRSFFPALFPVHSSFPLFCTPVFLSVSISGVHFPPPCSCSRLVSSFLHAGLFLYLHLRRSFFPALFPVHSSFPLFCTPACLSISSSGVQFSPPCPLLPSRFLFFARRSFPLSPSPAFIFPRLVSCSLLVSSFLHAGLFLYLHLRRSFFPALFPVHSSFPLFCTPVFPSIFLLRRSFFPALFPVHSSFPLFCTPVFFSISNTGVHFPPPCSCSRLVSSFFARRLVSLSPPPAFSFSRLVHCSRLVSYFCTPACLSISSSGLQFLPPCSLLPSLFLFFARRSFSLSPSPTFIFPSLIPCSRLFSYFLHAGLSLYPPPPAFIFSSLVPCSRLVSSFLHAGLSLYLLLRRSVFPALSPASFSFPLFCTPVFPSIFLLRRSFFPTLSPVLVFFPLFCTPVFPSISISGVQFSPPCFQFTPRFLFFARRSFSLSPSPAFSFPRLVSNSRLFSSVLHAGLFLYLPPPAFIFPSLVPCSRLVCSLLHAGLSLYLQHRRSFFSALSPAPVSFPIFLHAGLSLYLHLRRSFFPALFPIPASFPLFCTPVFLSIFLLRRSFFPALSPVPASFPLFCTPASQQPLPFQSLYLPFAPVSSTRHFSTSSTCSA